MAGIDWEAAAAIGVLVGALVTGFGVIVTSILNIKSNRLTRQGLEQEQAIAENSAARSEAAARLTEEYTRRIVDALEKIAAEGPGGRAFQLPTRVSWELVHHGGDRYRLTNTGEREALDVKIETHETLGVSSVEGSTNLGPGEALTFMAAPTMATKDSTVTIRWRQPDEDSDFSWRYPLPRLE
jgi:hypothetical protein